MIEADLEGTPTRDVSCPLCGTSSIAGDRIPHWGHWRICRSCTLEFADPLRLPASPESFYEAAYTGRIARSGMRDFVDRTRLRESLKVEPELWFWTPAFSRTLTWLAERLPPGSTVLEVGCGLGFLLHALRRMGFDAVGLDVSRTVVEMNRADGFRVWHGSTKSMPVDWVRPSAVVAFFMLHHLVDPRSLVEEIRSRWPEAYLALAQYGPSNRGREASQPPRTLTRWNARSLRVLLESAGYDAAIESYRRTGPDHPRLRPLRRLFARSVVVPEIYRLARRVERRVLPRLMPSGPADYVLGAYAEPAPSPSRFSE